jgi:hypothetical protein
MTPLAARNGHRDSFRGKKKQHAGQRGMHCKNVVPHRGHGVTDITGGMGSFEARTRPAMDAGVARAERILVRSGRAADQPQTEEGDLQYWFTKSWCGGSFATARLTSARKSARYFVSSASVMTRANW